MAAVAPAAAAHSCPATVRRPSERDDRPAPAPLPAPPPPGYGAPPAPPPPAPPGYAAPHAQAPPGYAAPQAEAPTQVLGQRALAIIIDTIPLGALYIGLLLALGRTSSSSGTFSVSASGGRALAVFALSALGSLLYFGLFEGLRGATPGQLICAIRVGTAEGARPGVGRALVRTALRVVDGLFFYLVGWIAAMANGPGR